MRIGTFNVLNLARPGEECYPNEPVYTAAEYADKCAWIGGQLRRMAADVVGFQEVFHEDALREAGAGVFEPGSIVAPGADGVSGPRVGLATRLPLAGPPESITDFPPGLDVPVEGLALPLGSFSRPILRARVLVGAMTVSVYVAHLKSKRPVHADTTDPSDPREAALGKARALIRRAAEAAALRFLVLDDLATTAQPVILLGDLNDGPRAVTTDIILGDPREPHALYSTHDITTRITGQDVSYSHIYRGHYENLDHILVSGDFHDLNPDRIGEVTRLHHFTDHLTGLDEDRATRAVSDHAQLVAEIRLRPPGS
ncbi:endonuclease/exonuclease/phosphatase family protein [Actinokineospora fastidiosa]|uniref:Nuclease n=1 Tax=Actinokineospora fastidiosa TaxID=1816 RepID=A0A918LCN2_9PSEU|nr:endonuclease/exonuclease/phosphatase family protein [Actinokineospora fastidiosa]GGS31141.1 nuclease [Actinokineospora fastidiosa]